VDGRDAGDTSGGLQKMEVVQPGALLIDHQPQEGKTAKRPAEQSVVLHPPRSAIRDLPQR